MQLKSKDLLGIRELDGEEIELILDTAESFREISTRAVKKVPTLRGRTIVSLFLEPSTRTRVSFELAGKRLSADVVNISARASAVAKGECLKDTAKTIEAMNADLVVMRHSAAGAPHFLAKLIECGVINAGDGAHEHPTQALLDLFTIKERLGKIEGLQVVVIGDIAHSRVARSNILALTELGASVTVVGPPTLIPVGIGEMGCEVSYDLDTVLSQADVVYALRIQLERQTETLFPSLREYAALFGLNEERAGRLKKNALIMHPGPMNRGVEITAEVADLPQSVVTDQVANGVAVRMAILYLLIGGGESV